MSKNDRFESHRLIAQRAYHAQPSTLLANHVVRLEPLADESASCDCGGPRASCGCSSQPVACHEHHAAWQPEADMVAQTNFPDAITLTPESQGNVVRAPDDAWLYCMADKQGQAHCALSAASSLTSPDQRSTIRGQTLEPIRVSAQHGTGHQQVARHAGIPFDEASARVGYVNGEGVGFSLHKRSDCERDVYCTSAFNRAFDPHGGRRLPDPLCRKVKTHIDRHFPACDHDV